MCKGQKWSSLCPPAGIHYCEGESVSLWLITGLLKIIGQTNAPVPLPLGMIYFPVCLIFLLILSLPYDAL